MVKDILRSNYNCQVQFSGDRSLVGTWLYTSTSTHDPVSARIHPSWSNNWDRDFQVHDYLKKNIHHHVLYDIDVLHGADAHHNQGVNQSAYASCRAPYHGITLLQYYSTGLISMDYTWNIGNGWSFSVAQEDDTNIRLQRGTAARIRFMSAGETRCWKPQLVVAYTDRSSLSYWNSIASTLGLGQ